MTVQTQTVDAYLSNPYLSTSPYLTGATGAMGMEAFFAVAAATGMEALIYLYDPKALRILCDFKSRGLKTVPGGNNSWGNPLGTGQNWVASSTQAGDFQASNLNTDIVEQYWRSATGVVTGVTLKCDVETSGEYMDTFAMLGHNLTSSATVTLIGANDSAFATPIEVIPLEVIEDDANIYYVAPTVPLNQIGYWKIEINDPTNPDGFLKVGTIVFGQASIFFGECFTDEVSYQLRDFADVVETEGFTNVANSRTVKKIVGLDFRLLNYSKNNFKILRRMFQHERTITKCLWIPTPDPDDAEYTARFAVFGKLASIPNEVHKAISREADYVTFRVEVDESK